LLALETTDDEAAPLTHAFTAIFPFLAFSYTLLVFVP
jgi:hypothetical protein